MRDVIADFGEFDDVSDEDRDLAFKNTRKAAEHYHVEMTETDWRQLGTRALKRDYSRDGR